MIITWAIDYYGVMKSPCVATEAHVHLPHFWYDPDRFRRYFCRGER